MFKNAIVTIYANPEFQVWGEVSYVYRTQLNCYNRTKSGIFVKYTHTPDPHTWNSGLAYIDRVPYFIDICMTLLLRRRNNKILNKYT